MYHRPLRLRRGDRREIIFLDLPGDNGKSKPLSLRRFRWGAKMYMGLAKNIQYSNPTSPEGMLFFPFCRLSRNGKEMETQRSLRLERVPHSVGRVGGETTDPEIAVRYLM